MPGCWVKESMLISECATYLKKNSVVENLLLGAGFTCDLCRSFSLTLPTALPSLCWALNSQSRPLALLHSECSSVSLIFSVDVLVLVNVYSY